MTIDELENLVDAVLRDYPTKRLKTTNKPTLVIMSDKYITELLPGLAVQNLGFHPQTGQLVISVDAINLKHAINRYKLEF